MPCLSPLLRSPGLVHLAAKYEGDSGLPSSKDLSLFYLQDICVSILPNAIIIT